MKNTGKAFLAGLLIAGSALVAPAVVSAGVVVDVDVAPPALRVEPVPPARAGFVWAPGFWDYRGHGHVWVGGRWLPERRGWHWVPDHWDQAGPHWHHSPGYWARG
jgi:hypothetical protein